MKKIKVINVKTGKVSEITPFAWDMMKKTGRHKSFDIIDESGREKIKFTPTPSPSQTPSKKTKKNVEVETPIEKPESTIDETSESQIN
jgi:hypothetical protein